MKGRGQTILQNISLNISLDVIRVPKACMYFRKIVSYLYKFYKYLYTEHGQISSELREKKL